MRVRVNDIEIFFDVTGPKTVPNGPVMRERPTLIVLHGGPGGEHGFVKPEFFELADVAQIVMIDLRGHGQSSRSTSDKWTLPQFGRDVRDFCDALGIERPVVMGMSFGSFVAQSYATQFPDHMSKLVLSCSAGQLRLDRVRARYEHKGDFVAARAAEAFWHQKDTAGLRKAMADYVKHCAPYYTNRPDDPNRRARMGGEPDFEMMLHFMREGGEMLRFNFLPQFGELICPVLVVAGTEDPICTIEDARDIYRAIKPGLCTLIEVPKAGHPVYLDNPAAEFGSLRWFLTT